MINAEQITTRLRMMSDADLQRFAEMHKTDPYMFPLAFNESNMRKQMRAAGAAQAAQPQPPVNEQAVAAMTPQQLPENRGIGQLNPNLRFADGGLVAFAGGGDTEYSTSDDQYAGEMPEAYLADGGTVRLAGGGDYEYWPTDAFTPKRYHWTAPNPLLTTQLVGEPQINKLPYARAAQGEADAQAARNAEMEPWPTSMTGQAKPPAAPSTTPPTAAPASAAAAKAAPAIPSLAAMPRLSADQFSAQKDIDAIYEKAKKEEAGIAEERVNRYLANRPAPETFEEQKALLKEAGADAEKQQRMDEGLAWLTFASKVMTPGMNPIQALVEGAAAGTSQYAAAQKELKKAERERKMGLAALAQAERAAARQDYDAVEDYRIKAAQHGDQLRIAQVNATAEATGKDKALAAHLTDSALNRAAAAANTQAQIGAQMTVEQMRDRREQLHQQMQLFAAQNKLNQDQFKQLLDFAGQQKNIMRSPEEILKEYVAMQRTYGAMQGAPTVSQTADVVLPRK